MHVHAVIDDILHWKKQTYRYKMLSNSLASSFFIQSALQRIRSCNIIPKTHLINKAPAKTTNMKITPLLFAPLVAFSSTSSSKASALSTPSNKLSMPPLTSPSTTLSQHLPLANKALSYLDSSPDPFHAVQTSINLLKEAGFQQLSDDTDLCPGGKYYFTKNKSSLIAFSIGKKFDPRSEGAGSGGGFKIIGAHTDSPNLKIKPYSKRKLAQGYVQLAVECYGGGLW